jgi:mannosylglycerate hydrolase
VAKPESSTEMGQGAPRAVVVVPHTHWDREWYAPFQRFRMRLVGIVDQLLDLLDRDPGYAHFMLDGQMAVVDDYLALRPHEQERIRRLASAGRLALGPWYVLMDEFLVSGETIIRDLQLGLDRAAAFGGATEVGYLPDMFGHIAQMPQLLRGFGFEHAVVWRGVPAAVDRTGFWWRAPDGSTVRAQYLPDGYGNGATLPTDAKDLVAAVARHEEEHGPMLVGPILWLNGADHLPARPWLGRVVAEADALSERYDVRIGSLADALMDAPTDDLPAWEGELRSGARANLLMGVASNRVDVRQAAAAAERWIERVAEPLSALYLPAGEWPGPFLDEAWGAMIRNSAHDSICACSHDDVVDAVLVRYQEARHIGEGLAEQVVPRLAGLVGPAGPLVVNSSARSRGGVVEVRGPGPDAPPGTQLLGRHGGDEITDGITRADAALLVQAALDAWPDLTDASVTTAAGVLDIRLHHDPDDPGDRYDGPVLGQVRAAAAEDATGPARITITTPRAHTALVAVEDVPGFGWAVARPTGDTPPVAVDGWQVANGSIAVTVADDGTLELTDGSHPVSGLGRLVDGGDCGDTYNYNPPAHDTEITEPDEVTVQVLEGGPVRARLAVERRYTWPVAVEGDRRVGSAAVTTTTLVEVVAGSPLVRLTTTLDNPCRDHRLRVWFPLPEPAAVSRAECAFAVVTRGLEAEGGATERALPTFPSRRFMCAGGLTVVHDGLPEYELVDIDGDGRAHTLALTLLRCTGTISRGPMAYRPLPAGPPTPTPAAQLPGRHVLRYGVQLGDDPAAAYAAVDDAFLPLLVTTAPGGGPAPERGSALEVTGAEVSAVVRDPGGRLVVRLFNPTPEPVTARVPARRGWRTDLRGRPADPFEETVELGPWAIATVSLDDT